MNPEPRSISRYRNFDPTGIKIHPFKRGIACLSKLLPKSWRFFLLGLPARGDSLNLQRRSEEIGTIQNGIASHFGAHLSPKGVYIQEYTAGAGNFIETKFLKKQRCFPRISKSEGRVLSMAFEGDQNYYRWLMETLPRLRLVREGRVAYDWMYIRQAEPFHRESLRMIGCDLSRVIPTEKNRFQGAPEIIVPRFVDETEVWIVPWLQAQFLPLTKTLQSQSLPKRIYISRRKATSRRVANENELMEKLEPLGFVSVAMEDHEFIRQIALVQNAECVIGPHGAGLANLIFCSSPALVIELIAREYPYTFYPQICRQLNLEHHTLFCVPVDPARVRASDLKVDVAQVVRLVERFSR